MAYQTHIAHLDHKEFEQESRVKEVYILGCDIIRSKFKPQVHYYVYFQTNTFGKDMNPLFP